MSRPSRRTALNAGIVAVALGLVLAGCAGPDQAQTSDGTASADNPFGVAANTKVDVVVFDGGYGTEYAEFAAGLVEDQIGDGVTVEISPTNNLSQALQPRFVGGTPPDTFTNDGADAIPITSIQDQLEDLSDFWNTKNYDGVKITDAVFPGVKDVGEYDGSYLNANYVMTLFSLWYSRSLFEEKGWNPPATWAEMADLCTAAKADGKYLFTFGKEAAVYYQWLVLDSAIKQGGFDVINDISNLEPGAWSNPDVKAVLAELQSLISDGCFVPGGAGTQFTQAQAQWSNDQEALFYYSGSWIESEMKEATADGFEMTAWPAPLLNDESALPFEAAQAGPAIPWSVPKAAASTAGGKEFLRALFSKEAASKFSELTLAPTVVKDTVPADGFGSTALASTMGVMENAGDDLFSWVPNSYSGYYGIQDAPYWVSFLAGDITAQELIDEEEKLSAAAAADDSKPKKEYDYGE
ncbi:carbohydrate ABC transporter, N-acetylglucosamine/diacetylchitobiose-binding protein [Microbacterium sp. NEAU-LLC]|uniref:Carbohydrate ABC transporter, N-acetylglucosamine/diacetylchitobiose-binding protein n=1 Tax=Microbacterium helvum TaxID=2773713 RepID=A0ABR8NSJ8_9MICO|nr:N-acetylglucosamine/diacetylchitobiose ABC transporter substrate-binding protein [Microbacterium helvum]MBD3943608.1 carbohydrate ABC transporter, N-acetylglucosamine/diacetylchitobiose-binding protein [Microbacterium helvum]